MAITSSSDRKTLHRGSDTQATQDKRTSTGRQLSKGQNTSTSLRKNKQQSKEEASNLGSTLQEQVSLSDDETINLTPAHETVEVQAPTTSTSRQYLHAGAQVRIVLKLNLGLGANQR